MLTVKLTRRGRDGHSMARVLSLFSRHTSPHPRRGAAAQAHHSVAGEYDTTLEATVDGVVTEFRFVNPHPFVHVKESRSGQLWRLDMDNRREFEAIGFVVDSLKPGDRVVASIQALYIQRLDRPADGSRSTRILGFMRVS